MLIQIIFTQIWMRPIKTGFEWYFWFFKNFNNLPQRKRLQLFGHKTIPKFRSSFSIQLRKCISILESGFGENFPVTVTRPNPDLQSPHLQIWKRRKYLCDLGGDAGDEGTADAGESLPKYGQLERDVLVPPILNNQNQTYYDIISVA